MNRTVPWLEVTHGKHLQPDRGKPEKSNNQKKEEKPKSVQRTGTSFMTFHESDTVEFKKSLALIEPALKSVCGFLNHHGGIISFGRTNSGESSD